MLKVAREETRLTYTALNAISGEIADPTVFDREAEFRIGDYTEEYLATIALVKATCVPKEGEPRSRVEVVEAALKLSESEDPVEQETANALLWSADQVLWLKSWPPEKTCNTRRRTR